MSEQYIISPNKRYRLVSKERLLFVSHSKQREILGANALVEEIMPLCGKEIKLTLYDDSDGTFKCEEVPEYWLPSYLLEEISNNSQLVSSVSNNQSSKIKRHK